MFGSVSKTNRPSQSLNKLVKLFTVLDKLTAIKARVEHNEIITNDDLLVIAKLRSPTCIYVWGHSGSTGCIRRYTCNVCGTTVATDSAKWKKTVHAHTAIREHLDYHREHFLDYIIDWATEVAESINDIFYSHSIIPGSDQYFAVVAAVKGTEAMLPIAKELLKS